MILYLSGFYAGLQHQVHYALAVLADANEVYVSPVIACTAWNCSSTGAVGKYRRNDEFHEWKLPREHGAVVAVTVTMKPSIRWCQISAQIMSKPMSADANASQ